MTGAGLPGDVRYSRPGTSWFEIDEPLDEPSLSATDRAFAAALRARAHAWGLPLLDSWVEVWEDDDWNPGVFAGVVVPDLEVCAAQVVGSQLYCGCYEPQGAHFIYASDASPGLELRATGSPDELADVAARWFEGMQRGPLVMYLWKHAGTFYAGRCEFADTGALLRERYDRNAAPPHEAAARIAAGHYFGREYINTAGMTDPDAFIFVRGDRSAARIAPGLRELPYARLGGILRGSGAWLDFGTRPTPGDR